MNKLASRVFAGVLACGSGSIGYGTSGWLDVANANPGIKKASCDWCSGCCEYSRSTANIKVYECT